MRLLRPPRTSHRGVPLGWSARVLRDAFSTLSPRRPAANECSTHRYVMYTDSPAALRCKTDPFQRSRLSDPEAPSSTSVTAEGAQTASVSHLYGTPRALPLRCGPAKLGYDPWYACHRLGLARNARRGRGQCISRPGSHPSTAVAGGPSRDVLCTRCTHSHAVKRACSFRYTMIPDYYDAQLPRIALHVTPALPA